MTGDDQTSLNAREFEVEETKYLDKLAQIFASFYKQFQI